MTDQAVRTAPAPDAAVDRDLEPPTVPPPWTLLAGLGILLALWVLVMPPFAGSDEHDHAYRAAAAARGEWDIDPVDATRGTGAFLDVPSDIVRAARPECQHLVYTEAVDCVGTPAGHGKTRVASGAGRYHPLFYAVIGTAALPFHGVAALYVMRLATALLAAAFVWMAVRATSTWARTRWPYVGIAAACTPVAIYSSAIAAPNGVEMMAALALWTSLIGLLTASRAHVRQLAVLAAISGATLATLRPLGPLWCLVVLAAVLLATPVEAGRIGSLLRRPAVLAGAGLVALSAVQATLWVVSVDALKVGGEGTDHTSLAYRLGISATQLPAWILQAIAAFPLRDQATHTSVYACYLLLFGILVTLALRFSQWRIRVAICLLALAALLFPYVTTVSSFDRYGAAWQGRYGLPVAMGIVVLASLGLDRSGRAVRGPTQLVMLLAFAVAQAVGPIHTFLLERHGSPQAHSATWVHPSLLVVVVVAAAGALVMSWGAFGQGLTAAGRSRVPG